MVAHFGVKGIKVPQSESKVAIVLKQTLHLNCTALGTRFYLKTTNLAGDGTQ